MEDHHFEWVNQLFLWPFSVVKRLPQNLPQHIPPTYPNFFFLTYFPDIPHIFPIFSAYPTTTALAPPVSTAPVATGPLRRGCRAAGVRPCHAAGRRSTPSVAPRGCPRRRCYSICYSTLSGNLTKLF